MATNEITRYDIELNTIPLGALKSSEMNLFFSIVTKMKDKENQMVRFYFDELRELSDYTNKGTQRFLDTVRETYRKLLSLNFGYKSKTGVREEYFILFSEFVIDRDENGYYVDVQIYDKAIPLLNDLTSWVRYSLKEFNSIRSTYAKTLFRLLKQYRTTGYFRIGKKEFNELMAVPKSYKQNDVNKTVLNPSLEQLAPFFKNLTLEKEYLKKQGRPLKGYIFRFTPEANNKDDFQVKSSYKRDKRNIIPHKTNHKKTESQADIQSVGNLLKSIDDE